MRDEYGNEFDAWNVDDYNPVAYTRNKKWNADEGSLTIGGQHFDYDGPALSPPQIEDTCCGYRYSGPAGGGLQVTALDGKSGYWVRGDDIKCRECGREINRLKNGQVSSTRHPESGFAFDPNKGRDNQAIFMRAFYLLEDVIACPPEQSTKHCYPGE